MVVLLSLVYWTGQGSPSPVHQDTSVLPTCTAPVTFSPHTCHYPQPYSPLSSCKNKIDGVPVGKHPLVNGSLATDHLIHPSVPWFFLEIHVSGSGGSHWKQWKALWTLAFSSAQIANVKHSLPRCHYRHPSGFGASYFMHWSSFSYWEPFVLPEPCVPATEVALISNNELSALYPEPTSPTEWWFLVCLECLHCGFILVTRTTRSLGANRSLFVHWNGAKVPHPVSKQWISVTFSEMIHHAYCLGGRLPEVFMRILVSFGVSFENLPCSYLVVLMYLCQTLSFGPC